jgi:hypothetical protein
MSFFDVLVLDYGRQCRTRSADAPAGSAGTGGGGGDTGSSRAGEENSFDSFPVILKQCLPYLIEESVFRAYLGRI